MFYVVNKGNLSSSYERKPKAAEIIYSVLRVSCSILTNNLKEDYHFWEWGFFNRLLLLWKAFFSQSDIISFKHSHPHAHTQAPIFPSFCIYFLLSSLTKGLLSIFHYLYLTFILCVPFLNVCILCFSKLYTHILSFVGRSHR